MPYILEQVRTSLNARQRPPQTPGELNYLITKMVVDYLQRDREWDGTESYGSYNEVIGVLECAKMELYRRRVAVYEDRKAEINGDVY
jgi:hypothetical protein